MKKENRLVFKESPDRKKDVNRNSLDNFQNLENQIKKDNEIDRRNLINEVDSQFEESPIINRNMNNYLNKMASFDERISALKNIVELYNKNDKLQGIYYQNKNGEIYYKIDDKSNKYYLVNKDKINALRDYHLMVSNPSVNIDPKKLKEIAKILSKES